MPWGDRPSCEFWHGARTMEGNLEQMNIIEVGGVPLMSMTLSSSAQQLHNALGCELLLAPTVSASTDTTRSCKSDMDPPCVCSDSQPSASAWIALDISAAHSDLQLWVQDGGKVTCDEGG